MAHIRMKILQHQPDLFPGFPGVDAFDGIEHLRKLAAAAEIHMGGIGLHPVAHGTPLVLHTKILDLMAHGLQLCTQFENIGFRSAVGMQKLIDH